MNYTKVKFADQTVKEPDGLTWNIFITLSNYELTLKNMYGLPKTHARCINDNKALQE